MERERARSREDASDFLVRFCRRAAPLCASLFCCSPHLACHDNARHRNKSSRLPPKLTLPAGSTSCGTARRADNEVALESDSSAHPPPHRRLPRLPRARMLQEERRLLRAGRRGTASGTRRRSLLGKNNTSGCSRCGASTGNKSQSPRLSSSSSSSCESTT